MQITSTSCQELPVKINKISLENPLKEEIKGRVKRSTAQLNNNEAVTRNRNIVICDKNEIKPFKYEDNGKVLIFQQLSHDYIMRCPKCKMKTKQIIQHLAKSNDCTIITDITIFKSRFQAYKTSQNRERHLLKQRNRRKLCDDKQKAKNIEQFKENLRKRQEPFKDKQKANNIE